MSDERLRRLERAAQTGGPRDVERWQRAACAAGEHDWAASRVSVRCKRIGCDYLEIKVGCQTEEHEMSLVAWRDAGRLIGRLAATMKERAVLDILLGKLDGAIATRKIEKGELLYFDGTR